MANRHVFTKIVYVAIVCSCGELAPGQIAVESALLQLVEQVDVPARTAGVLAAIQVDEGSLVSRGDLLGQIDDSQAQMLYRRAELEFKLSQEKSRDDVAIRSAQQALTFARSELSRLERAASGLPGSISKSQLEESKLKVGKAGFDLESAEYERRQNKLTEQLKAQELALGKFEIDVRRIMAPVPGVVVEVLRHAGEWVEPGDKVVRIVRIDRLRAEGLIPGDSVALIQRGMPAIVTVVTPHQKEQQLAGKVAFVSPEVNPVNGLIRVTVEIENVRNSLKPGLRARITIPVSESTATAVRAANRNEQ